MQKHTSLARFTDKIFELLADDHIGWDAARTLGDIASSDQILTKRNHAVMKVAAYPFSECKQLILH